MVKWKMYRFIDEITREKSDAKARLVLRGLRNIAAPLNEKRKY